MRMLAKILIDSIKANKAYFLFLLLLVVGSFVYSTCSHSLIESMYEGRSINVLNNLIQYQHKHSLAHYLELADYLFIRILFLLFSLGSFVYLLYLLVFSTRKVSLFWPIFFFAFVITLVYILNSNHRVYSYHGFYRAGIVYQILNGFIPPPDYLFAGESLRSPWGFPFLTTCVVRIFQITPFYAFALLNIVSLLLVTYLVYKISRFLIDDRRANVFSVLVSIFGTTIFTPALVSSLSRHTHVYLETRAVPVFMKFFNVNGVPVGLVFFFLFIYSSIRILLAKQVGLPSFYLFVAVLGCGFFYPPMFPGLLAGAGALCVLLLILRKRNQVAVGYRRIILMAAISFTGVLLLIPYGITISKGIKEGTHFANYLYIMRNLLNYVFISLPLIAVLFFSRNHLKNHLNRLPLLIILILCTINALGYIFIHFPADVEYKFLQLSLVCLGILGGISFDCIRQRLNKMAMLLLMLLFFLPCAEVTYRSLTHLANVPITYEEKGRYIHSLDTEEDELYEWIRQNTTTNSVFVDTELSIPIYAQRRLFIGTDKENRITAGYGIPIDYLLHVRHGYDPKMIQKRKSIVKKIYNQSGGITTTETEAITAFNTFPKVYIVTREYTTINNFDRIDFIEVFRSRSGIYRIYQYPTTTNVP
jgi:hypothetical protein